MSKATVQIPPALLKAWSEGRCVLFVGSGVSYGEGIPSAADLAATLVAEMKQYGAEQSVLKAAQNDLSDLSKVATLYGSIFQPEKAKRRVCELVKEAEDKSPARVHAKIARFTSLEHIVTTNWDTLIEKALPSPGTIVVRRESELRNVRQRWTNVYKIHGCISLPDEIVVDLHAYDVFSTQRAPFADLIKTLLRQFVFVCVGHSMQDSNFRSLLGEVLGDSKLQPGSHFFVLPHNAILQKAEFGRWGFEHISATAEDFAAAILRRYQSDSYSPGSAMLPIEKKDPGQRPP